MLVRNQAQAPMIRSNTAASMRTRVRRIVDSDGGRPSTPSRSRASVGVSWTHSATAVNERALAHTAASAIDRGSPPTGAGPHGATSDRAPGRGPRGSRYRTPGHAWEKMRLRAPFFPDDAGVETCIITEMAVSAQISPARHETAVQWASLTTLPEPWSIGCYFWWAASKVEAQ